MGKAATRVREPLSSTPSGVPYRCSRMPSAIFFVLGSTGWGAMVQPQVCPVETGTHIGHAAAPVEHAGLVQACTASKPAEVGHLAGQGPRPYA